jgi:hypothetical protein
LSRSSSEEEGRIGGGEHGDGEDGDNGDGECVGAGGRDRGEEGLGVRAIEGGGAEMERSGSAGRLKKSRMVLAMITEKRETKIVFFWKQDRTSTDDDKNRRKTHH